MESNKPHDKLFKATFSIRREAIALAKNFFPKWISASLDFDEFELNSDSFIVEELEEYFMDVVYNTKWKKGKGSVKISIIFEHKSYPDNYLRTQLGFYVRSAYHKQKLSKEPHHLVLPVLLYHGRGSWEIPQIAELCKLPNPHFA